MNEEGNLEIAEGLGNEAETSEGSVIGASVEVGGPEGQWVGLGYGKRANKLHISCTSHGRKREGKKRLWNVVCCVEGCPVNDSNCADMRFFNFPRELDRRNLWIKLSRPFTSDTFRPSHFHRICQRHFLPGNYNKGHNPSDYGGADPTIDLPTIENITLRQPGSSMNSPIRAQPRVPPNAASVYAVGADSSSVEPPGVVHCTEQEEQRGLPDFLLSSVQDVSEEISAIREEIFNLEQKNESNESSANVEMDFMDDSGFENYSDHPLAQFAQAFHAGDLSENACAMETSEEGSELLPCCREIPEIKEKIFSLTRGVEELHNILKKLMHLKRPTADSRTIFGRQRSVVQPGTRGRPRSIYGKNYLSRNELNSTGADGLAAPPAARGSGIVFRQYRHPWRKPILMDSEEIIKSGQVEVLQNSLGSKKFVTRSDSTKPSDINTPVGIHSSSELYNRPEPVVVKNLWKSPRATKDSTALPVCIAKSVLVFDGPLVTRQHWISHGPHWARTVQLPTIVEAFDMLVRDGLLYKPIRYTATPAEILDGFPETLEVYKKTEPDKMEAEELDPYSLAPEDYTDKYSAEGPKILEQIRKKNLAFEENLAFEDGTQKEQHNLELNE